MSKYFTQFKQNFHKEQLCILEQFAGQHGEGGLDNLSQKMSGSYQTIQIFSPTGLQGVRGKIAVTQCIIPAN